MKPETDQELRSLFSMLDIIMNRLVIIVPNDLLLLEALKKIESGIIDFATRMKELTGEK